MIFDRIVKSKKKSPSPLTGEGWGEGEKRDLSAGYIPLPLIPSRPLALAFGRHGYPGRGNGIFYELIKLKMALYLLFYINRKQSQQKE